MAQDSTFNGFPKKGLTFFKNLAANNNKTWFEEHRSDYDKYVLDPARDFILDMGRRLKKIAPDVNADPRVNKSLFRLNRDTRFSKDKTPYKTNVAVWFWEGPGPRMECSGFYLHIEPALMILGAGIHCFPPQMMESYRQSVIDPKHGPALVRAVNKVLKDEELTLGGKHYKRTPRGYDPGHKNADLLLYNGLYVGLESKIPKELYTAEFCDYCFERFKKTLPLHRWLLDLTKRTA